MCLGWSTDGEIDHTLVARSYSDTAKSFMMEKGLEVELSGCIEGTVNVVSSNIGLESFCKD